VSEILAQIATQVISAILIAVLTELAQRTLRRA
jgi:hypothetical protein